MKNKKIIMYLIIVAIILIVLFIGYFIYINIQNKKENRILEYIPEKEITEEQLRETIITLYFVNSETETLMAEARKIDARKLLEDPYKLLIELLIEGPKNDRLTKVIPENTKINNIEIINNIAYLDFSSDFINGQYLGEKQEKLIINSIVDTLTQLNEINGIYIKIDGKENLEFPDKMVNFNSTFTTEG